MSVLIAFDTATAFAMSFGTAEFALAQTEAKLVGEIVGRFGRSPNPAIVRAITKLAANVHSRAATRVSGNDKLCASTLWSQVLPSG